MNNILNDIESINTFTTDAQESVFESVCSYSQKEFDMIYCEYLTMTESYYQEGIGSAIKTGVNKIIELIKKGISFLGGIIRKIIDFFKRLFKKDKKNVNNILLDDVLDPNNIEETLNTGKKATIANMYFIDLEKDEIIISKNPFNKIKAAAVYRRTRNKDVLRPDIDTKPYDDVIILLLKHPDLLDLLLDIVQSYSIEDGKLTVPDNFEEIVKRHDEAWARYAAENNGKIKHNRFNIKILQGLEKKINEIRKIVDKWYISADHSNYDDSNKVSQFSHKALYNPRRVLDNVQNMILQINMSMNIFLRCVKNVYLVDVNLYGTVDSVEKLDTFIFKMLENGYPSKVVSDNCHMVVSEVFGKFKESTGQTRFVVIPKSGDVVYKCAMNASGLGSNKIEEFVWGKYKKYHKEYLLAEFKGISKNKCVVTQEKCDTSKTSIEEFKAFLKELDDATEKNNDLPVISHRKQTNFARHKDGSMCVMDYGIIQSFLKQQPSLFGF